jgi:hypothetical protein
MLVSAVEGRCGAEKWSFYDNFARTRVDAMVRSLFVGVNALRRPVVAVPPAFAACRAWVTATASGLNAGFARKFI